MNTKVNFENDYKKWIVVGWGEKLDNCSYFLNGRYNGLFLTIGLTREILDEWYCVI